MAFDLLDRDGRDLIEQPLCDRRARLEDVVAGSELVFAVRRLAADGLEAWNQVVERGYEGYVAKDEVSPYEGGRTERWLKVKQKGWTDAENRWQRRLFARMPQQTAALLHVIQNLAALRLILLFCDESLVTHRF
jgi:hypothetical protein